MIGQIRWSFVSLSLLITIVHLEKGRSSWLQCFSFSCLIHTALADMFVAFLSFWACPLHSLTFLSNLNLEVVVLCIWEVRSRLFGGRAKKLLPCLKAITDRVEWVWAGHHFSRRWPTYDVYSVYTCVYSITLYMGKKGGKIFCRTSWSSNEIVKSYLHIFTTETIAASDLKVTE